MNYPINESMGNNAIATKPISLSSSIALGQNQAHSIIEMFNNPNLRSPFFVPCTDNNYEQYDSPCRESNSGRRVVSQVL